MVLLSKSSTTAKSSQPFSQMCFGSASILNHGRGLLAMRLRCNSSRSSAKTSKGTSITRHVACLFLSKLVLPFYMPMRALLLPVPARPPWRPASLFAFPLKAAAVHTAMVALHCCSVHCSFTIGIILGMHSWREKQKMSRGRSACVLHASRTLRSSASRSPSLASSESGSWLRTAAKAFDLKCPCASVTIHLW